MPNSATNALTRLLDPVAEIARAAGAAIMTVYAGDFTPEQKTDGSPVTAADHAAEAVILPGLANLTPGVPVLSEEQAAAGHIPELGALWWCVDPLDGTKEFLKRNGEFVVSIGLILDGAPVLGVLFAPALDELYAGCVDKAWAMQGGKSWNLRARQAPSAGKTALVSRSHRDAAESDAKLAELGVRAQLTMGSALKFGRLAAGQADVYLRLGPTSEWDTAGGQAVLEAAGGSVCAPDGTPLGYGKGPRYLNPGFIARGRS